MALKWSITDRFHEYLYGGHFEVYTDNNPLTYVLTTAKLDAAGQCWIASLANYNFKIFYRSGKLNVEADALSRLPWRSTQMERGEPLIAKMMLQSKIEPETDLSKEYPPQGGTTEKYGHRYHAYIESKRLDQGTNGGYRYP